MSILCKLGRHDWIYSHQLINSENEAFFKFRECERCKIVQINNPVMWYSHGEYIQQKDRWTRIK